MNKETLSKERKQYLRKEKMQKVIVLLTQIGILVGFLILWECLANAGIIDSFITSQPSRIWDTFMNLTSNDLLKHIQVTCFETIVGFLSGTMLGFLVAILLWWSPFLSKVAEPYLVVLNSLPKIALRASYNHMGRSRHTSNYCNGTCNCDGGMMTTNVDEPANALNIAEKRLSFDGQAVADLFSKIRENEKIDENIILKLNRQPKESGKTQINDFADQMIYYRNLLGYSQKQVAKAIGVSEDTYRRYELKQIEVTCVKKILKIIKFLKFTGEPLLSEYVAFLMSNPIKQIEEFLKREKMSKSEFSELLKINRRTLVDWFNGTKSISKNSYEKIKLYTNNFQ